MHLDVQNTPWKKNMDIFDSEWIVLKKKKCRYEFLMSSVFYSVV